MTKGDPDVVICKFTMNSLSSALLLLWGLISAESLEVGLAVSEPAYLYAQEHGSPIVGALRAPIVRYRTVL